MAAGAWGGDGFVAEYDAAENVVAGHDLHATMLHLMGADHKRLTIKIQGRGFRLTDVHGNAVKEIVA